MIRINNIKMPLDYKKEDIESIITKALKLKNVPKYKFSKLSIDDREKNNVKYIISVDVEGLVEKEVMKRVNNKNVMLTNSKDYIIPQCGDIKLEHAPIIIGAGPAGLFCGLFLAKRGFKPIIFERGMDVDKRSEAVDHFWEKGELNPNTNVQFGEGGAGTFSDGKLNTVIKDKSGRRTAVLNTFVSAGADESICYLNKPHLGTDALKSIVKNIRNEIIKLGGQVHFESKFINFSCIDRDTVKINVERSGKISSYLTNALVLAIGHSSRDTFELLYEKGMNIEQKPFAIGLRIEHKKDTINKGKYGDKKEYDKLLPTADYKFAHTCKNGRSVYSFCMCPGGFVVNASSEEGYLCVNGMSYSHRDNINSNSAVVVNVTPEDYASNHPLAGMFFQRKYEELAFKAGNGMVPVQTFKDYMEGKTSEKLGEITPEIKGKYKLSCLNSCLPEYVNNAIIEGVLAFDKYMPGFSDGDALLSGVETRTSSPIRLLRNENFVCEGTSIYPCGEGPGYAGGITSAAVDGIKVSEAIIKKYKVTED